MDPMVIMLFVLLLLFVGMNYFGKKKQAQANQRRMEAIVIGNNVRTHSGFYGTIVDVDGDTVTLESSGGAETIWHKNAINGVEEPPFAGAAEAELEASEPEEPAVDSPSSAPTVSTVDNPIEKQNNKDS